MSERRQLSFSSFRDVADEVDRLRRDGYDRTGEWSLAQACRHLDKSMQFLMRAGAQAPNTAHQDANRPMLDAVFASGRLPSGIQAPPVISPEPDCDNSAVDCFLATVERFDAFPGPFAPHRLFGNLSRDEMRRLAMIHCAHHLSHLVPTGTGATMATPPTTPASNG